MNSIGGIVECRVHNMPSGLGSPIYMKLDGLIASGMMSINAVKGVEIGEGMHAVHLTGDDKADEIST